MKIFFTKLFIILSITLVHAQSACDNWVKLNNRFAAVPPGDLDVTGNHITV